MLFIKHEPFLLPALLVIFSRKCLSRNFLHTSKPWGITNLSDWRHLSQRIQNHESSTHHVEACVKYEQWRNMGTIEEALHESLLEKNKLLEKCFEKTSEYYVDVNKVQLTFSRIQ